MKKLIPALCMLLIAATMLGTSTFAWFSMNGSATANGLTVTASAPKSLLISTGSGFSSSAVLTHDTSFGTMSATIVPTTYMQYNIDGVAFYALTQTGSTLVTGDGSLQGHTGKKADGTTFDGTPYYTVATGTADADFHAVDKYVSGKTYYQKSGSTYSQVAFTGANDAAKALEFTYKTTLYLVKEQTGTFFVADAYNSAHGTYYHTNDKTNACTGITDASTFATAVAADADHALYYYVEPQYIAVTGDYDAAKQDAYYRYEGSAYVQKTGLTSTQFTEYTTIYIKNETPATSVQYFKETADAVVAESKTYYAYVSGGATKFVGITHSTADNDTTIADYATKYYGSIAGAESSGDQLVVYEVVELYTKTTSDVFYDTFTLKAEGQPTAGSVLKAQASFVGAIPAVAANAMHILLIDKTTHVATDLEVSSGAVVISGFVAGGTSYDMYYYLAGNDTDCKNSNLTADAQMNLKLTFTYEP